MRGGQRRTVEVELGSAMASAMARGGAADPRLEGVVLGPIPPDASASEGVEGVLVMAIDAQSPAFAAGLRERDVIVSVNQSPVRTPQELNGVASSDKDKLLLHVRRGEDALFIAVG